MRYTFSFKKSQRVNTTERNHLLASFFFPYWSYIVYRVNRTFTRSISITRAVSYRLYEFYMFTNLLTCFTRDIRYIFFSFFFSRRDWNERRDIYISHTQTQLSFFFFFLSNVALFFSFLFDNKFVYNLSYRLVRLEVLVGGGRGEGGKIREKA